MQDSNILFLRSFAPPRNSHIDRYSLLPLDSMFTYMRVEQKVHERGFLCVSLWVCNEQSRLKLKFFFSEMAKVICLAKVLAKVHVDMSNFAL